MLLCAWARLLRGVLGPQFLFQVVGFDCVDDESMPDPKVELASLGFVATTQRMCLSRLRVCPLLSCVPQS
jgi:hypothetical protein